MLTSGTRSAALASGRSLEPWATARSNPRPRAQATMRGLRDASAAALRAWEAPPRWCAAGRGGERVVGQAAYVAAGEHRVGEEARRLAVAVSVVDPARAM